MWASVDAVDPLLRKGRGRGRGGLRGAEGDDIVASGVEPRVLRASLGAPLRAATLGTRLTRRGSSLDTSDHRETVFDIPSPAVNT